MITNTNIVIDSLVYQKIMHWVNKSNYEVSGLGKIIYEGGTIRVIDALLFPQKNTSAHTDIEGEHVAKAMYTLRETPGELRWWWHSHVNMDVFWSGTDRDTIEKISAGGWFVATVFNKRHEMRSCLNMVSPLPLGMIDNIPTRQLQLVDPKLVKLWDGEYEKNVENMIPKWSGAWQGNYSYPKAESHFQKEKEGNGQLALPGTEDTTKSSWVTEDEVYQSMMSEDDWQNDYYRGAVPKGPPPRGPSGVW